MLADIIADIDYPNIERELSLLSYAISCLEEHPDFGDDNKEDKLIISIKQDLTDIIPAILFELGRFEDLNKLNLTKSHFMNILTIYSSKELLDIDKVRALVTYIDEKGEL